MAQAVKFELELRLLVLCAVRTQLGVLDTIAHQVELRFNIGDDFLFELIDFISYGISHRTDRLAQNCALAFNTIDLGVELFLGSAALCVFRRRMLLPILALLAFLRLLILHFI